jgi:Pyrimidine dimer DNA glycosylase
MVHPQNLFENSYLRSCTRLLQWAMQTFLPYPDYANSAYVLDRLRLGKQRLEAKQLILALTEGNGWSNHPAARMWEGHIPELARYGLTICMEWRRRGYNDSLLPFFLDYIDTRAPAPAWVGDERFHEAHRSNLVRKDPRHYRPFFPYVEEDIPYIWPIGGFSKDKEHV